MVMLLIAIRFAFVIDVCGRNISTVMRHGLIIRCGDCHKDAPGVLGSSGGCEVRRALATSGTSFTLLLVNCATNIFACCVQHHITLSDDIMVSRHAEIVVRFRVLVGNNNLESIVISHLSS
jgi:hypothetical protein